MHMLRRRPSSAGDRIRPKQKQIKASKITWICFDLLGFIFPNRGFSRGYRQFKQKDKKIFSRPSACARRKRFVHRVSGRTARMRSYSDQQKYDSVRFWFCQANSSGIRRGSLDRSLTPGPSSRPDQAGESRRKRQQAGSAFATRALTGRLGKARARRSLERDAFEWNWYRDNPRT